MRITRAQCAKLRKRGCRKWSWRRKATLTRNIWRLLQLLNFRYTGPCARRAAPCQNKMFFISSMHWRQHKSFISVEPSGNLRWCRYTSEDTVQTRWEMKSLSLKNWSSHHAIFQLNLLSGTTQRQRIGSAPYDMALSSVRGEDVRFNRWPRRHKIF